MLKRMMLYHKINKFYRVFGNNLDIVQGCITYKETNDDIILLSVQYDLQQALEITATCCYPDVYAFDSWLKKLDAQITKFRERKRHTFHLGIIALLTTTLCCGYTIGRHNTIHSTELHNITENGYNISFGDETHTYTFD